MPDLNSIIGGTPQDSAFIGPIHGVNPTAKAKPRRNVKPWDLAKSASRAVSPPAQHKQPHQHNQNARHQIGFLPIGHQPLPEQTGAGTKSDEDQLNPRTKQILI